MKSQTVNRALSHGALAGIYTGYDRSWGSIIAEGISFVKDANGYSLIGTCKEGDLEKFQPLAEALVESLTFISQREVSELKPPRLRIHEVKSGETWADLTKTYFGSSEGAERLAEYNGLEASHNPNPGVYIKVPSSLRL